MRFKNYRSDVLVSPRLPRFVLNLRKSEIASNVFIFFVRMKGEVVGGRVCVCEREREREGVCVGVCERVCVCV